jgi:hypothetical protein
MENADEEISLVLDDADDRSEGVTSPGRKRPAEEYLTPRDVKRSRNGV